MRALTPNDPETPAPGACPNCGHRFGDPRPHYCPDCGQETNVKPPRIGEFIQQFGGAYFSTEGALWRTLLLLLFKPGELTVQYLAGRRRRYVLPLRLYLTISVLALVLLRLSASPVLKVEPPHGGQAERARPTEINIGGGRFGRKAGVVYCNDLPVWLCQRLQKRFDVDAAGIAAEAERFNEHFLGNLGGAMFILLPAFALWLKLAYRNRRMRYTEHLVFALHLQAFWFVAVVLFLTGWWPIVTLAVLAMPVYAALAARRVYDGRWWANLLRGAAVMAAYGVTLMLSLTLVGLWTFLV